MDALTINNIEKVLDERVRPSLAQHGGDIQIEKLEDNMLHGPYARAVQRLSFGGTDIGRTGQYRIKRGISGAEKSGPGNWSQ